MKEGVRQGATLRGGGGTTQSPLPPRFRVFKHQGVCVFLWHLLSVGLGHFYECSLPRVVFLGMMIRSYLLQYL